MKTRTFITLLTGLLTAGATHAVEEASWGQVKNEQTVDVAAKASKNANQNGRHNSNAHGGNQPTNGQTDGNYTSANFNGNGGHFAVKSGETAKYEAGTLKVMFQMPRGALDKDTVIDMFIEGETASTLKITFGPAGLKFRKECDLKISIGPDRFDIHVSELDPYHDHRDGTVDEAGVEQVRLEKSGDWSIKIKVPGFSRYGLWRGN